MFDAQDVKDYLRSVIADIDAGKAPRKFRFQGVVRTIAIPAAIGVSTMGLASCGDEEEEGRPDLDRGDLAEAKADGYLNQLCELFHAESNCDPCDLLGFYGDGEICDNDICDRPDPDCSPIALYSVPMPETLCWDGIDNDFDGDVDCDDSDCAFDRVCALSPLYAAPMEFDCRDYIDNDGDGDVDCDDSDCERTPECGYFAIMPPHLSCDDGSYLLCDMAGDPVCEDGTIVAIQDGCWVCVDPETCDEPIEERESDCGDYIDNDGDGDVDCDDSDCERTPECGIIAIMPPHLSCDDGSYLLCDMAGDPVCEDGTIVAIQDGCWVCVDPETCEEPVEPSCNDGTELTCDIFEVICADGAIVAVQDGCLVCVDPETCE